MTTKSKIEVGSRQCVQLYGAALLIIFLGYAKYIVPIVTAYYVGQYVQAYQGFNAYQHISVWWATIQDSSIGLLLAGMFTMLGAVQRELERKSSTPWWHDFRN